MANGGEVCCILSICCPPAAARESFIDHLVKDTGCERHHAECMVEWTLSRFALAPKSMEPAIHEIVRMAKHHNDE